MGIMDSLKTGVDSTLSALDPLIDLGNGIYRSWLTANASKVFTGGRTLVKIGGNPVGLIQQISISADIEQQRLLGIGDVVPTEIVAGEVVYQISWSKMLVVSKTLAEIGLIPDDEQWLLHPGLELELIDSVSRKSIIITGCQFTNYSLDIAAHRVAIERFTMTAARLSRINWEPKKRG